MSRTASFRIAALIVGSMALAACDPVPGGPLYRVIEGPAAQEPEPRPQMSASWYSPGMSVADMSRAAAVCESQVDRQVAATGNTAARSRLMQQCMAERGVQSVRLPECSPQIRTAALRAGPSGRTVMPPLAGNACIMTLPDGQQPILPNPSEYL